MGSGCWSVARNVDCTLCSVRARGDWRGLTSEEMAQLNCQKSCRVYAKGGVIFRQGQDCQGVYCVFSGLVALYRSDSAGNRILVRLVLPGQVLGYRAILAGPAHSLTADVLAESRVFFVPKTSLEHMMGQTPRFFEAFCLRLGEELSAAEDTLLQTIAMPVRSRFIILLLRLSTHYAVHGEGGFVMTLPITRQSMADMLGIRPETIARIIRSLTSDVLVNFEGRTVHVSSTERLLDEVGEYLSDNQRAYHGVLKAG